MPGPGAVPARAGQAVDTRACLAGDAQALAALMEIARDVVRAAVRWTLAHRGASAPQGAGHGRKGPRSEGRTPGQGRAGAGAGGAANGQDVEAVAREVLLRLLGTEHRLLATYDPQCGSLRTWLCVVAHSAAMDHLRDRACGSSPSHYEDATVRPSEAACRALLALGPGELDSRQRQVLRLYHLENMNTLGIARFLDVAPQTVRSHRDAALARLRSTRARQERGHGAPGADAEALPRRTAG
ncbi:MAG: hypothetical protein H0S85_01915 [Desulfovibrionaceae bacterium]|nr:hypothetical protein [Desulfovibrionaceae bacterium]